MLYLSQENKHYSFYSDLTCTCTKINSTSDTEVNDIATAANSDLLKVDIITLGKELFILCTVQSAQLVSPVTTCYNHTVW